MDYLTNKDRETASEVLKQYNLTTKQKIEAWAELEARACEASTKFKSYDAMHCICAELEIR